MAVAEERHTAAVAGRNQESRSLEVATAVLRSQWAVVRKETDYSADID